MEYEHGAKAYSSQLKDECRLKLKRVHLPSLSRQAFEQSTTDRTRFTTDGSSAAHNVDLSTAGEDMNL